MRCCKVELISWIAQNNGETELSALTEKKQTPFKERLDRAAENSLSLRGAFDANVTVVRSNGTDTIARHAEQTAAKSSRSAYREVSNEAKQVIITRNQIQKSCATMKPSRTSFLAWRT